MKPLLEVFGDRPFRFSVDSLKVQQSEGMHDMATVHLANPGVQNLDDLKGKPCTITWGRRFAAQTFYGYIDTTGEMNGENDIGGLALICLGATSVMRSGQPHIWRKSTPYRIARTITRPYRMALVVDKKQSTIDSFMQTSESDWGALNLLAMESGMVVIPSGTAVRMVDVRRALGRAATTPVRALLNPESFVQLETPSPVGYDTYAFTGVDSLGNNFAVRGGPDDGIRRHSGERFESLGAARNAEARKVDRQKHLVKAMATYAGQLGVRCGDLVSAEGLVWFVSSCDLEMSFDNPTSYTHLVLHRSPGVRPVSAAVDSVPTPALRAGKWVSSKSYEVEV
jgi:hypothetical protein